MGTQIQSRRILAFGWSVAVVSVLSSLLVILKEKSESTMALMKAATGHHWITHGLLMLALFVVIGLVFEKIGTTRQEKGAVGRLSNAIVVSIVISGLILAGFFLLE